jgi:protein-L-isoaspartate(D-aspartate) O-methyltransferase
MSDNNDLSMRRLLEEVERDVRETAHLTGCTHLGQRVRAAFTHTPRHEFVPGAERGAAYGNYPLPIGQGQTISQPYIVALMTELIHPHPDHVVLEVGTGSGYQAAVLASLVKQVYSVEIVAALGVEAEARLRRLGYHNVAVRVGNGRLGWPEHAPYDGILVTAAGEGVPPALVEQLKPGGSLVIPIGAAHFGQQLRLVSKDMDGRVGERDLLPVVFVPLTGGAIH